MQPKGFVSLLWCRQYQLGSQRSVGSPINVSVSPCVISSVIFCGCLIFTETVPTVSLCHLPSNRKWFKTIVTISRVCRLIELLSMSVCGKTANEWTRWDRDRGASYCANWVKQETRRARLTDLLPGRRTRGDPTVSQVTASTAARL